MISSYPELKTAIANWLDRSNLVDRIPEWIELVEDTLNADPDFRLQEMIKRSTATLSAGYIALPGDWLEADHLQINETDGKPRPLDYVTRSEADRIRRDGYETKTRRYTFVGREIEVVPYTSAPLTIEMVYYAKIPRLTVTGPTNWLLAKNQHVYLYGALAHSAPYLRDDERVPTWVALYRDAKDALVSAGDRAKYSGGSLKTRSRLRNR